MEYVSTIVANYLLVNTFLTFDAQCTNYFCKNMGFLI